jgi:hypothetical protein
MSAVDLRCSRLAVVPGGSRAKRPDQGPVRFALGAARFNYIIKVRLPDRRAWTWTGGGSGVGRGTGIGGGGSVSGGGRSGSRGGVGGLPGGRGGSEARRKRRATIVARNASI